VRVLAEKEKSEAIKSKVIELRKSFATMQYCFPQ
jgi:hypothetical protein